LSNKSYNFAYAEGTGDKMKTLGIGEVKAHFSDILERVKGGEKVIVGYGKKKEKVAVIVPYTEYQPKERRKLGLLQGKARFELRAGFKMSDEELLAS
jgi:antitoxin (DNA-binding transcriptional repressor) of toxin-antitoxin stability system